jgi:hypothetical protein
LDLDRFKKTAEKSEILNFFKTPILLEKADLLEEAQYLKFNDNKLDFFAVGVNTYFASVAADFISQKLLLSNQSFTFETVMSSLDFFGIFSTLYITSIGELFFERLNLNNLL